MPADIHAFDPVLKTVYEGKPTQQVLTQKLDRAIQGLKKASDAPETPSKA